MLTGMMVGAALQLAREFSFDVELTKNEHGIYNPWFVITSRAGNRAVVTVTAL